MRYVRRWSAAIMSRIDGALAQVENHEALADAAIADLQEATALVKVQVDRVRKDGEALLRRHHEERELAAQWRELAQRATDDDEQALECLRRSKRAMRTAEDLERRLEEHARTERELSGDVRTLEARWSALREKRNLMRTRQSRADAMSIVHGTQPGVGGEVEQVFKRWEIKLEDSELASSGSLQRGDELEAPLLGAEEEAELRAELTALRGRAS